MNTINFDFDGTLYEWDVTKSLEDVGKPDYPLKQRHMFSMLYAAGQLNNDYPGSVRIASAVLNDGCMESKKRRISKDIGTDVAERSIFTLFGENKVRKMNPKSPIRVGIKVYNGINGNNGTWKGYSVHARTEPAICYMQLSAIIERIMKENPYGVDILIDDFSENLREWDNTL